VCRLSESADSHISTTAEIMIEEQTFVIRLRGQA
jgi:hypothetical protein